MVSKIARRKMKYNFIYRGRTPGGLMIYQVRYSGGYMGNFTGRDIKQVYEKFLIYLYADIKEPIKGLKWVSDET